MSITALYSNPYQVCKGLYDLETPYSCQAGPVLAQTHAMTMRHSQGHSMEAAKSCRMCDSCGSDRKNITHVLRRLYECQRVP